MSWILRQFRANLANEKENLEIKLNQREIYRAFTIANSIAQTTGRSFGVEMSLNFPAGQGMPNDLSLLGTSNISITFAKGRKKFEKVSAEVVRAHAEAIAREVRFEPASYGYEGFHVIKHGGRITVLPGAIYLWLRIDERVEEFLDWLFINEYSLIPLGDNARYIK